MSQLSYLDLQKRNNIENFVNRCNGASFQIKDSNSSNYPTTGRVRFSFHGEKIEFDSKVKKPLSTDYLTFFLKNRKPADSIDVELVMDNRKQFVKSTQLFKDKEFGGTGGKSTGGGSERQELGLIDAIKQAGLQRAQLPGIGPILDAWKNSGLSQLKQEPYIDVYMKSVNQTYGVSCKGSTAPSLAGGGLVGLQSVVPDMVKKMETELKYFYEKEMRLKEGDVFPASAMPDIFFKIPNNYVKKLLIGNEIIGGPVDYMYIGPMTVSYKIINDKLILNGNFYSIEQYMQKIPNFYIRCRMRDIAIGGTIQLTYEKTNKSDFPMFYKNPTNNRLAFRIVVTDTKSSKGKLLTL